MIAPLTHYVMAGVIWYQGEANVPLGTGAGGRFSGWYPADNNRAYQYRRLFRALIQDWRRAWGEGDFLFLFVQLPNIDQNYTRPSAWAELREAQAMALSLPQTGMAVTIDIGDPKDVHIRNKQEVGRRLALAAEAIAYGRKVVYSGPMYQSMSVESGSVRLHFRDVDGGLAARGGTLRGFEIAGDERKFVDAEAKIDGKTVVVSSSAVPLPVAVRYAWADNPACNLFNKSGLPASPFRTDDWPTYNHDASRVK
jgi:sialate O-acetylesterase